MFGSDLVAVANIQNARIKEDECRIYLVGSRPSSGDRLRLEAHRALHFVLDRAVRNLAYHLLIPATNTYNIQNAYEDHRSEIIPQDVSLGVRGVNGLIGDSAGFLR